MSPVFCPDKLHLTLAEIEPVTQERGVSTDTVEWLDKQTYIQIYR